MWPFKKPKLNGNLIFLVAYRNSDYEMDISKEFVKTLTRKQIKMLNETCDIRSEDLRYDAELLKAQERQIERDRIEAVAREKRGNHFAEELDHNISGGEEYQQYFNNNVDKMLLTDDEEEKLLKTFADYRERIKKYQEEVNNNPEIRERISKKYADMFLKSAGGGNEK